jgi:hypothetical protein
MVRGTPLFRGDSEVEQLLYIFRYGCDVVWKSFLTAISFNNKENRMELHFCLKDCLEPQLRKCGLE